MKVIYKTVLAFAAIIFLIGGANAQEKRQVYIISGIVNGSYNAMAEDISKICGNHIETIVLEEDSMGNPIDVEQNEIPFVTIETTEGAVHNFIKLSRYTAAKIAAENDEGVDVGSENEIYLEEDEEGSSDPDPQYLDKTIVSFLQFDVLVHEQMQDFNRHKSKKKADNIRILLPLGYEEIQLLKVKQDEKKKKSADIKKLEDLKKRKVNVGSKLQGTNHTSNFISEEIGISWIKFEHSTKDAIQSLLNERMDAMFFVGSAPVLLLNGLAPQFNHLELVPIKDKELEEFYKKVTIPANTYHWQEKDVETFAVQIVLAVDIEGETDADKQALRKLLADIKNNIDKLQEEGHPAWKRVDFNFSDINWEPHDVAKEVFDL
jgi:TRAP-type uncharacterized transport system substrate-binding protein